LPKIKVPKKKLKSMPFTLFFKLTFVIVFLVCGAILTAAVHVGDGRDDQIFRFVPIPRQEHGYSNFESLVVRSDRELDEFFSLTSIAAGMSWNKRDKFEEAIRESRLNFAREFLVLIRHTEESGSVKVSFGVQQVKSSVLYCSIHREEPPRIGTTDMAYYCFGFAVLKQKVKRIHVCVAGRNSFELNL
jgi:hypothetical protein